MHQDAADDTVPSRWLVPVHSRNPPWQSPELIGAADQLEGWSTIAAASDNACARTKQWGSDPPNCCCDRGEHGCTLKGSDGKVVYKVGWDLFAKEYEIFGLVGCCSSKKGAGAGGHLGRRDYTAPFFPIAKASNFAICWWCGDFPPTYKKWHWGNYWYSNFVWWGIRTQGKCTEKQCSPYPVFQYTDLEISIVQELLPCELLEFPCKYLGLPLSIQKLTKAAYNRTDCWPTPRVESWSLNKSRPKNIGAICPHINANLSCYGCGPSTMAFKEIDRIKRGFLWKGRKGVKGGHCLVAWPKVCRPPELGGLGISDLQRLS